MYRVFNSSCEEQNMTVVKEVTIAHDLPLFTTTIVQPKLGAELCPEKVFVSSHQTRKQYRYKPLGEEKGGDREAVHRHKV